MTATLLDRTQSELRDRRDAALAAEPKLRARNLAEKLDISEAELVALGIGETATPLKPDWSPLLNRLPALGDVMALTRNDHAVHEKTGQYGNISAEGGMGLVLGEEIDLRLFLFRWRHAFAVSENGRHSVQIFSQDGSAVHKIYRTDASDPAAWDWLVADFKTAGEPLAITPKPMPEAGLADSAIDVVGFQTGWDALKDTHEFTGLLSRFKVQRLQALRLAGPTRARPATLSALRDALTMASDAGTPIMVFVGNRGVIQIHTGPVKRLLETGPWFNVLDERFSLHAREDAIASAWVVWKPTVDGTITSLELFNAEGGLIASLFGKRKPGQAEDPLWRAIVNAVPAPDA